jgi:PPOX class probable F420-dependent enzyme
MSATLDDKSRSLLENKNFANVATVREEGDPHSAPVWVDVDGDMVLLNSAKGRAWPTNLERDPRVTITVQNLENPYEYTSIRGEVTEQTTDGADAHIDSLAKKYLDRDEYPFRRPGEERVIVRIRPLHVFHRGG